MIENAIRAAKLDVDFYNTVEQDSSLTGQAALLVAIVSLLSGIGNGFSGGSFFGQVLGSIVAGLLGWVIASWVMGWIGRTFFGGQSDFGEMQRVLGFAQAPRVIGIIPFLGWIAWIWTFVAVVVAVREGQDFSTGASVVTVLVGWIITVALSGLAFAIFS